MGVGSNCRVIGIRGVYEVVLDGIVITIIILHLEELRNLIDKGDVCNGRFIIHRRAILILIIMMMMILRMKPSCYQPGLEVGEAGATPRGHTNTTYYWAGPFGVASINNTSMQNTVPDRLFE